MKLWTRQAKEIVDEFDENGVYVVKKEYIQKKNDTISDYYINLYRWYTNEARKYINIPQNLEFPIWACISEEEMLQPTENAIILELDVPEEEVLLCNFDAWGYVVNYKYVPLNDADEREHENLLMQYGLHDDVELFVGTKANFYPQLKQAVKNSWGRIFTMKAEKSVLECATFWQLRKSWIKEVRFYEED